MELFYSQDISGQFCSLDEQESRHCVKVLRHKVGDIINVIDGEGSLMECRIVEASRNVKLEIISITENFGSHGYYLQMAVCPTKNIDRYEWFLEKATEIGLDSIVPVIGEHSERKIINAERCGRILLSGAKQSLKGAVPVLAGCCSVKEYILDQDSSSNEKGTDAGCSGEKGTDVGCSGENGMSGACEESVANLSGRELKLIAYCGEATKMSVREAVEVYLNKIGHKAADQSEAAGESHGQSVAQAKDSATVLPRIKILIGPEGDFSAEEVSLAMQNGFIPVHLGASRLRTETAAVVACSWVYSYMNR